MLLYDYIKEPEKLSSSSKVSSQLSQIQFQDRPNLEVLAEKLNILKGSDSRAILIKSLLNFPLFSEYDANYENATGYYINMIKILIRELSTGILNQLFDPETGDFPILRSLLVYSHHNDVMIESAARLGLLTIFKKSQGEVLDYVNKFAIPYHFAIIISFLNHTILNLENSIENGQVQLGNNICKRYEAELEYIDDILCLEQKTISDCAKSIFLNDFIIQFLFPAMTERHALIKGTTEISIFLLGKLMKTITNKELNEDIIKYLLPFELEDTSIKYTFNDNDDTLIKTIGKVRNTIITHLRSIISCTKTNQSSLYIIGILHMVIRSLNTFNDISGIFVFYKAYVMLLLSYFLQENVHYSELERIKLNLISSILEELATTITRNDGTPWFLIKSEFSLNLRVLYLKTCQKITYSNIMEFSFEIDENYKKYIENRENDILIDCSFLNGKIELDKLQYSEKECNLLKLFHLRCLCLQISKKTEQILPFLPEKIKVGQILPVKDCIFCKIVDQDNAYALSSFVKLTSSQFLVLEYLKDQLGKVIFSCYYTDLVWSEYKNNRLLLWEVCNSKSHKLKKYLSSIPTILLEFKAIEDSKIIVKMLPKAKSKQCEMIQKKLDDLLEIGVRQGSIECEMH